MKRWLANLRRRVIGRFTPAGWVVIISAAFSALLGLDIDSSVAYQTFLMLLGFLVVAWMGVLVFPGRFEVCRTLPRYGSVGDVLGYRVLVTNKGKKVQHGLSLKERFTDHSRANYGGPGQDSVTELEPTISSTHSKAGRGAWSPFHAVPPLGPNDTVAVEAELLPLRRGLLHFNAVRLSRTDPLGLLRSQLEVLAPQKILVLPRRYPMPHLQWLGKQEYQRGGVNQASSVGQADEYVSLRDYRRGDPLRHIHWRSWAKTGEPIVKEFEDEHFVRHGLVLDSFGTEQHAERFEEAVSIAASFACSVQNQESLLDLMFVGKKAYCFTAGRGVAHTDQILEILACAQLADENSVVIEDLTRAVIAHAAQLSTCVLVLIDWDADRRKLVTSLNALGIPVQVWLVCERSNRTRADADLLSYGVRKIPVGQAAEVLRTIG